MQKLSGVRGSSVLTVISNFKSHKPIRFCLEKGYIFSCTLAGPTHTHVVLSVLTAKCLIDQNRFIFFLVTGRSVGFCMLCELQKHIMRSFSHHQGEAIKPMAIIQKLKCKFSHQCLKFSFSSMLGG